MIESDNMDKIEVRQIILIIIFLFVLVLFFITNIAPVKALTAAELSNQITEIENQIAQLQKQLAELMTEKTSVWCYNFQVDLKYGDEGSKVKALQIALEKEGFKIGEDSTNYYFGDYTASAVVGFQEKYRNEILNSRGLEHGTGYVGETTRTKLNELYGCPVKPESEYKCPDLNGDGAVDIYDLSIISKKINACQGDENYDLKDDLDGDSCLTTRDMDFISKYLGKEVNDIPQCPKLPKPTKPEYEYSCPDINENGVVDISDLSIISKSINTCQGDEDYDSRGDVDGDNCLTSGDMNFINKHFGKQTERIAQCRKPSKPESEYKCPDLNEDGEVDIKDAIIVSKSIATCEGDENYNLTGDVDGDDCITKIDLDFVNKYFDKEVNDIPQCPKIPKPTISESEYRCPDLNGDGAVDIQDLSIISRVLNACKEGTEYNERGDVDRDGCLTTEDMDFVSKHLNKKTSEIPQCLSFDFSLSISPSSALINQGGSASATVTATLIAGYPETVSFSASGLPSGTRISFNPTNCSPPCSSKMTINSSSITPIGTYNITIIGRGKEKIHIITYSLRIKAPLKPESEYRCPDLNGDGAVDINDTIIISRNIDTCKGEPEYDSQGDVDGDGCLTNNDLSFVTKYFGKKANEIDQCVEKYSWPPATPSGPTEGLAGNAYTYSTICGGEAGENGFCYEFDWGDGKTTQQCSVPKYTEAKIDHSWSNPGEYKIRARAIKTPHPNNIIWSDWSNSLTVNITVPPPKPEEEGCWGIGSYCDSNCKYSLAPSENLYYNPGCSTSPCPLAQYYTGSGTCSSDGSGSCYKLKDAVTRYTSCTRGSTCAYHCAGSYDCSGLPKNSCYSQCDCSWASTGTSEACSGNCICGSIITESACNSCSGCLWKYLPTDGGIYFCFGNCYCSNLSSGGCNNCSAAGCSWSSSEEGYCSGSYNCSNLSQNSCDAKSQCGCRWDAYKWYSNFGVAKTVYSSRLQCQWILTTSIKPESEYKCPDLNADGVVDINDLYLISRSVDTCEGNIKYNPQGDVDGDGCLTGGDMDFVSKYFGKKIDEINQCETESATLKMIERMLAAIASTITQIIQRIGGLFR